MNEGSPSMPEHSSMLSQIGTPYRFGAYAGTLHLLCLFTSSYHPRQNEILDLCFASPSNALPRFLLGYTASTQSSILLASDRRLTGWDARFLI
mmetsp:Transcript_13116/g.20003  ORF Transcript_13116/g.20003 Transcript_13116/m.20003 type:complete len:93 (-) Transcript_13116:128-406(-)